MAEQYKIVVIDMPPGAYSRYRVQLVDGLGAELLRKRYRFARHALACIERWKEAFGATIEDTELSKIDPA